MKVTAMKAIKAVMIFSVLFVLVLSGLAGINSAKADELTASAAGVRGTLKINAPKKMIDLYLTDTGTSKPITGAKVMASITGPQGRKDSKELMGMKMGDSYSYMAMTEVSAKGRYAFDIKVEAGEKKADLHFSYDVK